MDGLVGPKCRLLFRVPPASRHSSYNPATVLVILKEGPELDLSRMAMDNTNKSAESSESPQHPLHSSQFLRLTLADLSMDDDCSGISIMEISITIQM